jgi:hypothetical protein
LKKKLASSRLRVLISKKDNYTYNILLGGPMTEEKVTENTQATPVQEPAAPQQESADLSVNDLGAMKSIIDLASSRGAFKPSEMIAVGQTYMKLSNFLATVAKPPQTGA